MSFFNLEIKFIFPIFVLRFLIKLQFLFASWKGKFSNTKPQCFGCLTKLLENCLILQIGKTSEAVRWICFVKHARRHTPMTQILLRIFAKVFSCCNLDYLFFFFSKMKQRKNSRGYAWFRFNTLSLNFCFVHYIFYILFSQNMYYSISSFQKKKSMIKKEPKETNRK